MYRMYSFPKDFRFFTIALKLIIDKFVITNPTQLMYNFDTLPDSLNQFLQVGRQGAVPESSIVHQMMLLALSQALRQVLECLKTANQPEQLV